MVDMPYNQIEPNPKYLICMYKEDLALNNLQWLICHKTQPNQMCQRTKYHDTSNHRRYPPEHELLWLCDICTTNLYIQLKYCKTFDSLSYLGKLACPTEILQNF